MITLKELLSIVPELLIIIRKGRIANLKTFEQI